MTGFQLATTIGLPTTALVVMVFFLVIARPDRDHEGNGVYAAYLATASVISLCVLLISATARVDRAADAAICFTMIVLMFIGALVAAAAGYTFFSPPNHRDEIRDLSGGQLLSYGGLVVVAFFIFRARFWGIRGQDPEAGDGEPPLAELSER